MLISIYIYILLKESDMGQRDSLDDSNTEDSASRSPTTADSDPALHVCAQIILRFDRI